MTVIHVRSEDEALKLAAQLNSTARDKPFVVVSRPAASTKPLINPDEIHDEVGDLASVWLLPTGSLSWAFTNAMPDQTQVYGGAGRVYPVGTSWVHEPRRSPLRFAFDAAGGRRATELLIGDALRMAGEAGLLTRPARQPRRTMAEVKSLVPPSRAIVRTVDGRLGFIRQELVLPDVDIEQAFSSGMHVEGFYDPDTKRFDPRVALLDPATAISEYSAGDVVLVQVAEVQETRARLLVHPGTSVEIERAEVTTNELDLLTDLMSPGEVIAARIVSTSPWRLSLLDVDDDEDARPAAHLFPCGPPWLSLTPIKPRVEPAVADDEIIGAEATDAAAIQAPEADPHLGAPHGPSRVTAASPLLLDRRRSPTRDDMQQQLADARREVAQAHTRLNRKEAELAELYRQAELMRAEQRLLLVELSRAHAENRKTTDDFRRSKTELRRARLTAGRAARARADEHRLFLNDEDQLRHDVYLAWARRIPAAEKTERPLPEYRIGPAFIASLEEVEGISRSKVLDVIVEVVTGLVSDLPGRDLHQLRSAGNGGAPGLQRDDGARCWRAALQSNTPQARRIHFWRLPNNEVELSRVVAHDDFRS